MTRWKLDRHDGFSLIEVMVALTILAVGLLALALLQTTAIKGNSLAAKSTVATQLAQDQMEQFRHTAWTAIASTPAPGYDTVSMSPVYANLPGAAGNSATVRGTTYFRVWLVTPALPATLRTVTVWTCWQDERQIWHNVMLQTQRADVGV
ncbi:MAG: type IV pilus modification protein PilV [Deltaproteobacteria bacterium]|nr:type IV pilus modification protein PilV [Deltaproteobacteria bacterium]MDH3383073.1 type IV pilus modification protein PilV [Deltaproteobacteria bacterium]